jgi:hypothetical protein
MTFPRLLIVLGIALILFLLGLGAGVWWYLNGPNEVDSAELVPANAIFFASIPNAAKIVEGYQTSHAKTLVENPNAKPLCDVLVNWIGKKNIDLLQAFLPNLSGQSFIAVTHFDYDHPEKIGLIAAMKPKAGLNDFGAFVEKLKATWPDIVKQGTTGTGSVDGVDYQWIRGPGAHDNICVAQVDGWIVTSWGEGSLQDWIERFRKKPTTSSLVKDVNYQKAVVRVGDDPMALVYVNCHLVMDIARKAMAKTNPAAVDYLAKKFEDLGGAAVGTRFENGEIVDRFTFLIPRPVQLECGLPQSPCTFDTLKFTGPDTRFYWAAGIDWKQYYNNLKDQSGPSAYNQTSADPMANQLLAFLKDWVRGASLDAKRNIVDALGSELSVQVDWSADETYPEAGLFVKVDKPDDFKPTINAIIETVRKAYATTGVIQELKSNGHTFDALQFVKTSPITPTITADGPYLGVFLTENQAVRSFQRDLSIGLTHRADFNAQMGDKRNGAMQAIFLDSPYLLDRAYRTAMPYVSLVGMFNKNLASMLQGQALPDDLSWLAPMGTWSCIVTPDEEGVQAYSVSGLGNQGILLAGGMGAAVPALQGLGYLPKYTGPQGRPNSAPPSVVTGAAPPEVTNTPGTSIIFITSESKIVLDESTVPENRIGDLLKAKRAANPNLKLMVRVDRNALPDVLSKVMDAGASAGFGVLTYSYSPTFVAPAAPTDTNAVSPPTQPDSATPATNATPAPIPPH